MLLHWAPANLSKSFSLSQMEEREGNRIRLSSQSPTQNLGSRNPIHLPLKTLERRRLTWYVHFEICNRKTKLTRHPDTHNHPLCPPEDLHSSQGLHRHRILRLIHSIQG